MSRNITLAAVMAVGLLTGVRAMAADPAPVAAATEAKPADKLSRILGPIKSIDTAAKTITLGGFGGGDQTVSYNDETKYMLDIPATASDIKVGDTLRAFTLGGGNDGASISPNFLNIVPTVDLNGPAFTGPFIPVEGVVATLKPLAITTPDKKTVTVNIIDKTLLSKSKDATVADVKTDKFGSAIVKGDGDGRVLTELHIIQPPDNN